MIICDKKKPYTARSQSQAVYTPTDRPRLIARLQAVEYIKFHDVSLESIPPPFWSLLHQLEGVRELEIQQMSFKSPIHFFRYICTLPALEALSISRSSIVVAANDLAPLRPKVPFCIPFLDVGRLSPGIFQWFLRQDPAPPVHTFRINLGSASINALMLRDFVEAIGPSVQNLQVTLPSDIQSYNQSLPPLEFSSFTKIRSVSIEGYLRLGEAPESCQFEDLMRTIFTQIISPLFEKVSLNFSLHIDETILFFGFPTDVVLDLFRWGPLPETLGRKCDNLRCLHLALRGLPPYQQKSVEESLRNGPFAAFENRDILSLAFL
ncbi:hypothetical protein H0H87_010398 [Tephrocybe sp. NHM501043]|nr:hypothetical protein H0H87_010398 [Tephrocybe sp. NHM501043]